MEYVTLIPWTPRTSSQSAAPNPPKQGNGKAATLCERTLGILQPIIFNALRPFPDARQALRLALMQFSHSLGT